MPTNYYTQNKHLFWRAAFGPMIEDNEQLKSTTPKKYFEAILNASSIAPNPITIVNKADYALQADLAMEDKLNADQKNLKRKLYIRDLKALNLAWVNEMANSQQQLLEKMALFWHGHFATRVINIFYQEQYLEILRNNALGNFGTLLKTISKSASMLNFLNNNKNSKKSPNENFAREVMELFTLGRGNYTEADVKNGARAFTGWDNTIAGNFMFNPKKHDDGSKTFLGETGNFNGDAAIDIILKQEQTAIFIVTKLYKFLVNETVDTKNVAYLADRFYKNNYEIKPLLTDIFTSSWFYEAKNIGVKIKSPMEFLVGMQRNINLKYNNQAVQLVFQKVLGQILFYPPNVAGWAGGKNYIDSTTLMVRLKLPQTIISQNNFTITPKPDDDVMMGMQMQNDDSNMESAIQNRKAKNFATDAKVRTTINWAMYCNSFLNTTKQNLLTHITNYLIQPLTQQTTTKTLETFIDQSSRNAYIQSATMAVMSMPEYQLC